MIVIGDHCAPAEQEAANIAAGLLGCPGKTGLGAVTASELGDRTATVVIGTPESNALVAGILGEKRLDLPGKDGFVITQDAGGPIYLISRLQRGCLYASHALKDNVSAQAGKLILRDGLVRREPVFAYRMMIGPTITAEECARYGMNALVMKSLRNAPLPYRRFRELVEKAEQDAGLPPDEGADEGARQEAVESAGRAYDEALAECHRYGIMGLYHTNEVQFPLDLVKRFNRVHPEYKTETLHNVASHCICPSFPGYWDLYKDHLREMMGAFAGIDAILVTTGDNHGDIFCGSRKCSGYAMEARIRDYVRTTYETLKSLKKDLIIFMRLHNLGDWYWYNFHIDLEKLAKDFPKDIIFEFKRGVPPNFDGTWKGGLGYHLNHLPTAKMATVAFTAKSWCFNPSGLFLMSSHNQVKEAVQAYAKADGVKAINFSDHQCKTREYAAHLLPLIGKLAWSPDEADPELECSRYFSEKFGEKSGGLIWDALRDSARMADKLMPLPYEIDQRKQFKPFRQYKRVSAVYDSSPGGEAICDTKSLSGWAIGEDKITEANIEKFIAAIDAVPEARAMCEKLSEAVGLCESGQKGARTYRGIARETVTYAHILRAYFSAYAHHQVGAEDACFLNLWRAITYKHLYTSRYDENSLWQPMKTESSHFYFSYVTGELARFDWDDHLGPLLDAVAGGGDLIFTSDDFPCRNTYGPFLLGLLGLKQSPGNRIEPDDGTEIFSLDEGKYGPYGEDFWYQPVTLIVRRHGKGRVCYSNVEEVEVTRHMAQKWDYMMFLPHMKPRAKGRFVKLLRNVGLAPGDDMKMEYFSPLETPLQWYGPLYNSGPGIEGVRFYKLVKYLGGHG